MSIIQESVICTGEDTAKEDNEICVCVHCRDTYNIDDIYCFDGEDYCEDCLNERTFICFSCNERFLRTEANHITNGSDVCDECFDYNYTRCCQCGNVVHNDHAYFYDSSDDSYCRRCWEEQENRAIKKYEYKPDPIFYGCGIFYGVELEIDDGGENGDNAEELMWIANKDSEHIYCKHDGSLTDGFEMVSHPMSLCYHTANMPWKRVLQKAVSLGYRSHDSGTCGLHVHVGRKELGSCYESREDVISRIVFFIEKHWEKILMFSRRTPAQMEKWAARYGCKENLKETYKDAKDHCHSRYVSLNLQNYSTIEFRFFRGSLRYDTFISALQFVDSVCRTAIKLNDDDFEAMTWQDFVVSLDRKSKGELIRYLKAKNLYREEM